MFLMGPRTELESRYSLSYLQVHAARVCVKVWC